MNNLIFKYQFKVYIGKRIGGKKLTNKIVYI